MTALERKNTRYRDDPAFRAECIRKTNANHTANLASATYHRLVKARKQIWNFKESIAAYQTKIRKLKCRLKTMQRRKEALELEWGQERSRRKRSLKECGASSTPLSSTIPTTPSSREAYAAVGDSLSCGME